MGPVTYPALRRSLTFGRPDLNCLVRGAVRDLGRWSLPSSFPPLELVPSESKKVALENEVEKWVVRIAHSPIWSYQI